MGIKVTGTYRYRLEGDFECHTISCRSWQSEIKVPVT